MKITRVTEYRNIIESCFKSDISLVGEWHLKAGKGLDACVQKTYDDMVECKVDFYSVSKAEKFIGYFGKEHFNSLDFLTGFFVMPECRNKENLNEYWNTIKSEFKGTFYCGVFEKNLPAVKFIKRNGGTLTQVTSVQGETALYFKVET